MLPIWMMEVMPVYGEPEQIRRILCKTLNLVRRYEFGDKLIIDDKRDAIYLKKCHQLF